MPTPTITLTRAEAQKLVDFCEKHKSSKFFIAKDEGAYLGYSKGAAPEQQCLFYFKGCDPQKNPDTYWETGQRLFGGDDFGELIPLSNITELLAHPVVMKIKLTVTAQSFRFQGLAE